MTKHVPDEALSKVNMSLVDPEDLIAANINVLNKQPPEIRRSPCVRTKHKVAAEALLRPQEASRARLYTVKNRLEKIMHRLYDLEPDNAPEKSLTVDLGVDLYQMENF